MLLGQEMISVFEAQVLILFDVGAGEMLKSVMAANVFGVGICVNAAHKALVLTNLRDFVKTRNLVNLNTNAPQKPADVKKYEEKARSRNVPGTPGAAGVAKAAAGAAGAAAGAAAKEPAAKEPRKAIENAAALANTATEALGAAPGEAPLALPWPTAAKRVFAFGSTAL